ncbi:hypothetical protein GGR51DRAFT_565282 [Nemania sp. FL0031]|nr:hypothetical protein GGR51DRAFT_565282 [Nemania sp. FL0031]
MSSGPWTPKDTSSVTAPSGVALIDTQELFELSTEQMLRDLHVTGRVAGFPSIDGHTSHMLYQQFISLVECKDLLDWEKSPNTLWVSAGPGRGKTMLLTGIARQLSINASENPGKWFLSYHFCSQEGPELDTPAAILKSLIWMILRQQPGLASHLERSRWLTNRAFFDDPNDFAALSGIFHDIIQDKKLVETYLLVDAIDECFTDGDNPGFKDLMRLVATSMASPKIKWLISTCTTSEIEPSLMQDGGCFHLDLDLNYHPLSAALERHFISNISKLVIEKGYRENLKKDIVNEMQARPCCGFLWAEIVCRALQAEVSWDALDVPNEIPDNIEQLYAFLNERIGKLSRGDPFFCREVLNTMAIALQPLHVSELAAILDLRVGQIPVDTMILRCWAFLEARDGIVSFIHASAKDYLHSTLPSDAHANMAKRLLDALSRTLIEANTEPLALSADQDKILASTRYASIYWIWHMNKIEDINDRPEIIESATSFLSTLFLQWLYVLDVGQRVTRVTTLLLQLEWFLRVQLTGTNRSHILPVIRDAHRLLCFHQSLSDSDCPNAYYQRLSTMLYCPGNSAIRQAVISKNFPWILAFPTIEDEYADVFLTLGRPDLNSVRCIEFFPDGRLIASGSKDSIVRIWDTQTGNLQHTLHGHNDDVNCLAVSTTGLLASGSRDKSVRVWEYRYAIGRFDQREFSRLPGPVNAVRFSPDGKYLIAASGHNLHMWGFGTEADEAQILRGHEGDIKSVAFSHDGSLIVSAGDKGVIHIWDTESRTIRQKIMGHDSPINCVIFSPVARQIASGSNLTMKIWNADTGELDKSHTTRGDVLSLAFSPCGSRLALAICSSTIRHTRVFDISSLESRDGLQGDELAINSVSFSPNGRFLASSSENGTIHFWYEPDESRHIDTEKRELQHHEESPGLAMTNDGSCVALFAKETVRLWDGETGRPLQTPTALDQDHKCTMKLPMFSPDKQSLVFGSQNTVCVFYPSGSKPLRRFLGHESRVNAAVFSPDNKFVASVSNDKTARLWDLESEGNGSHLVFKVQEELFFVAFSNDGLYLALAGFNDVYLWVRSPSPPGWEFNGEISVGGYVNRIGSVVFSPDSKRILVGRYMTIEVLDIQNRNQSPVQIELDWTPEGLWFDPRSTEYVMTDCGAQSLNIPSSDLLEPPEWAPYRVLPDKKVHRYWITWKNRKVIFIPQELLFALSCVRGHTVALGRVSGDVLMFRFSTEIAPPQLPLPQISAGMGDANIEMVPTGHVASPENSIKGPSAYWKFFYNRTPTYTQLNNYLYEIPGS